MNTHNRNRAINTENKWELPGGQGVGRPGRKGEGPRSTDWQSQNHHGNVRSHTIGSTVAPVSAARRVRHLLGDRTVCHVNV